MNPIPKEAASVVKTIRRDVPRPEELPTSVRYECTLRWQGMREERLCDHCPMGLHRKSKCRIPSCSRDFARGKHSEKAVHEFLCWWDDLKEEDAQEAVDALWP